MAQPQDGQVVVNEKAQKMHPLNVARAESGWLRQHLTQSRILQIHSQTLEHSFALQNLRQKYIDRLYGATIPFILVSIIACGFPFVHGRWRKLLVGTGVVGAGVCAALLVSAYRLGESIWMPRKFQSKAWSPLNRDLTIGLFRFLGAAGDGGMHWEPVPKPNDMGAEDENALQETALPNIYTRIDPVLEGIRIMGIEPGTFDADIKCWMGPSSSEYGYIALSYVWGDDPPSKSILVNGRSVMIRKSLDNAIRYIRLEHKSLTVWIDALCINQQDPAERNEQVGRMSETYQQAKMVVIFLGEGEDLSALFTFIQDINDNNPIDGVLKNSDLPVVLDQFWSILQMPWWSRVWVIQEFAYANRSPLFVYGHRQFSAEWLCYGFGVLRDKLLYDLYGAIESSGGNLRTSDLALRLWRGAGSVSRGLHILRSRQQLFHWRNLTYPARSRVSELLKDTQFYHATEPRDRLFGLQSLMMDPIKACFMPDYQQSMEAVNLRMAAYLLCIERWSDIYNYFPNTTDGTLPSWVPDFSANLERNEWSEIWDSSPELCLGELECWAHATVLGIRGVDCGRVIKMTDLKWQGSGRGLVAGSQDLCEAPPSAVSQHEVGHQDTNTFDFLSRILTDTKPEPGLPTNEAELEAWGRGTTTSQWLGFADVARGFGVSTNSPDLDVHGLQEINRNMAEHEGLFNLFKSMLKKDAYDALAKGRSRLKCGVMAPEIEKHLERELASESDDIDVAWKKIRTMKLAEDSGLQRDGILQGSIFTTEGGFSGLCPLRAQVGDRLIVLFGMSTPFLARRCEPDGMHILIGPVRANKEAIERLRENSLNKLSAGAIMYFK